MTRSPFVRSGASPLSGTVIQRKVRASRIRLVDEGTAHVTLASGELAIIDAADVALVAKYSWRRTRDGYVIATGAGRSTVLLHRLVMNAPKGKVVDHVNHDLLDNRRANLRVCTQSQNLGNQYKACVGASRFKGVSIARQMVSAGRPWKATIERDGRRSHLGFFTSELEAARAYDVAAREQWGEFALLNCPIRNLGRGPAGHETTPTRSTR